jgi:hypothetical protein
VTMRPPNKVPVQMDLDMPRPSRLMRLIVILIAAVLSLAGCSRVGIAYNTADFVVKGYAKDYLDLERIQLARWEPVLSAELARHREEELPLLAAYFDQVLKASRLGFDERNMSCLTKELQALYRRQAGSAVTLATPLLIELTPAQIQRLNQRFRDQAAEDLAELRGRSSAQEKTRRARRYVKSIEDWTGPLDVGQKAIVAEVTARMPETQSSLIEYRSRKRDQLIALLEAEAGEQAIKTFMIEWIVDFRDLPPELERGGQELGERIGELFIRLGASLDERQRDRLDNRLRKLRDDLMKLQAEPKMAPLTC